MAAKNSTRSRAKTPAFELGPVDKSAVEKVISALNSALDKLIEELPEAVQSDRSQPIWAEIDRQRKAIAQTLTNLDRQTLTLAVVGNQATGKTTLISQLSESWQKSQPQITAITEVNGETALPPTDADLVLFVTAADLMQSELARMQSLLKAGHRVELVFNKQDQLTPIDRQSVVARIQTRVEALGMGVSAIAARPNPVKVRRHQANGEVEEFTEQPNVQLESLSQRLTELVENNTQQLVWQTTLRQAKALTGEIQHLLNHHRRTRAMPIVEQMQWIAAGSAFASPLPSLDLLASTAINAQLIIDLGAVYGQTFSLQQAKTAAGTLAELLVKLGLVELSTQALGSLLKVHMATYVAGGALQAVSAAYLTRMVGLSLMDFFEAQSLLAPEKQTFAFTEMGDRLQTIFQATKQTAGLQAFVQQAMAHIPGLSQPQSPSSVPAAV